MRQNKISPFSRFDMIRTRIQRNENCRNFDRSTQLNEPYKTTQMASSSGSARGYKIEKRPQDSPPTNTIYDLGRLTVIPSGIQSQFTNDQQSTAIYVL